MRLYFTKSFEKDYCRLPLEIQKRLDKKLFLLLENFKHPSLRTRKMKGYFGIWEGRITQNYRFTFQVEKDGYLMRRAGSHSILENP